MSQQNIYDNNTFFEGYQKLRKNQNNANNVFEGPALFSLLTDLKDKTILDLGCGVGGHCLEFVNGGAKKVVGIDISKKMLEVAEKENHHSKITYLNLPMENLSSLNERFDFVVSSLAIHYVKDFEKLVSDVFNLLNDDGIFVFSQEHPFNTCFSGGERWTKDEEGNKLFANISNYSTDGLRESSWFVNGVKKYHRTFSSIVNTLVLKGFVIEKFVEPIPTEQMLEKYPEHKDLLHKPDFLVVRAKKSN